MITAVAVAVFFMLLVPGIGAFVVRRRWRRFRRLVAESASWPIISYRNVRETGQAPGSFRMYGKLQALEGDHRVWLNDGTVTAGVELEHVSIFVLPPGGMRSTELPDATPNEYAWHELSAIPEGTRFFVAGRAERTPNGIVFARTPQQPLLVIVHECPADELYARAIWTGRQRNEYWNAVTLPSLGAGFLAQLTLAFLRLPSDRALALFGLVLAVIPFLPLVPPGNVGFLVYRRLWRFARRHRGERDIVQMPSAYRFRPLWPGVDLALTPAGGRYFHIRRWHPGGAASVAFGRARGVVRGRHPAPPFHLFVRGGSAAGDPMPPQLVCRGDPRITAHKLTNAARLYELISVATFTAGLAVNVFLLLLVLRAVAV